jgi:hypothetical protein
MKSLLNIAPLLLKEARLFRDLACLRQTSANVRRPAKTREGATDRKGAGYAPTETSGAPLL